MTPDEFFVFYALSDYAVAAGQAFLELGKIVGAQAADGNFLLYRKDRRGSLFFMPTAW